MTVYNKEQLGTCVQAWYLCLSMKIDFVSHSTMEYVPVRWFELPRAHVPRTMLETMAIGH